MVLIRDKDMTDVSVRQDRMNLGTSYRTKYFDIVCHMF